MRGTDVQPSSPPGSTPIDDDATLRFDISPITDMRPCKGRTGLVCGRNRTAFAYRGNLTQNPQSALYYCCIVLHPCEMVLNERWLGFMSLLLVSYS